MSYPIICAICNIKNVEILKRILRILLKAGADINIEDEKELTPLMWACRKNGQIIPFLIRHGASVNALKPDGLSPLIVAASHGLCCSVNYLLDNGANINYVRLNNNALTAACYNNRINIVKILLERGASTNICQDLLIHCAIRGKKIEIMKAIFERVEIDTLMEDGETILTHCSKMGSIDKVEMLLECGADIDLCNRGGLSPLQIAMNKGDADLASLLAVSGADVYTILQNLQPK